MEGGTHTRGPTVERAMKVQEVIFAGDGQEDYLVASSGDHRDQ
jgi:hypothetical protein